MSRGFATAVWAICLGFSACSPVQLFPSEVMEGVDPNFDFSRWRAIPNQALERKIELGGRIIQSDRKDGHVTMVVTQLPIVQYPAYGPKDTGRRNLCRPHWRALPSEGKQADRCGHNQTCENCPR